MTEQHKRRVKGVEEAVRRGFTKAGIAKAIGTSGANLGNILRRGSPYSRHIQALDAWLKTNIYASSGSQENTVPPKDFYGAMAAKLRGVADLLCCPDLNSAAKAEELALLIRAGERALDAFRTRRKDNTK